MKYKFFVMGILLVSMFFCACKHEEEEIEILDVTVEQNKVIIAIPYKENTSYINIFRKDEDDDIYNIGQVIPKEKNISYIFKDEFVLANTSYTYCARYKIKDGYKTTNWSDEVSVDVSNYTDNPCPFLLPGDGSTKFNYDSSLRQLALTENSEIKTYQLPNADDPDNPINVFENYNLNLLIENSSSKIKAIELNSTPGEGFSDVSGALNMLTLLTEEFLNDDLKIKGLIFEYIESEDDSGNEKHYVVVHWSVPTTIGLTVDDEAERTFKIVTKNEDSSKYDLDYSSSVNRKVFDSYGF